MGLLARVCTLIRANINVLVSRAEDRETYADLDQGSLDTRVRHMEQENDVNRELEALKAKVGIGSAGTPPAHSGA